METKTASPAGAAQARTPAEGKIVIAYDGSAEARRAIEVAAQLLGQKPAVVVYVGPMDAEEGDAALDGDLAVDDYESLALDEQAARGPAAAGAAIAAKAGFAAEPKSLLASPPWMGIVDVANQVDAPVIVVGSRGLNRLKEDLEGSTSHDLARHAGRPVLVVPRAAHV
jgi:nucleotide-binding universal stress UspA family protein